jgi:flagellar hook protein FlgE
MSTISTALSGMNAASMHIGVSGHNIANALTPGFRRQQVQQSAEPQGGVRTTIGTAALPGDALAEDIVGQMAASVVYRANAQTLRTQRDLSGTLLDVIA